MIVKSDVEKCREQMQACVGKPVKLVFNGGRKRLVVREGVVDSCYPNVFTVRCARGGVYHELLSYSYVDLLTSVVEVSLATVPAAM